MKLTKERTNARMKEQTTDRQTDRRTNGWISNLERSSIDCHRFASLRFVIGLKNSRQLLSQSVS